MKVSINHLSFELCESGTLVIKISNPGQEYKESYYFSQPEIVRVISDLQGFSEYYPYYPDGSQIMRCHSHGLTCIHLNRFYNNDSKITGNYKEIEYILPGVELAYQIENFLASGEKSKEISQEIINGWKEEYAPKVKIVWAEGTEEVYYKQIESDLLEEKWNPLLRNIQIAENNSDGNEVVIYMHFDGYSDNKTFRNFYFDIVDNGKRIMNGGHIFHSTKNGKFSLNTHT